MNDVRKSIGWADYTINPVKGLCPVGCWYCYARKMYNRFKLQPVIELDMSVFADVRKLKKPARIFVGSTIDLFHNDIPKEWKNKIFIECRKLPHKFLFLTKQDYFNFHFTEKEYGVNFNIGKTIVKQTDLIWDFFYPDFISFEPLMSEITLPEKNFATKWIIIGAMTGCGKKNIIPKREWIESIIEQAKERSIPVFVKSNISKIYLDIENLKQFPKELEFDLSDGNIEVSGAKVKFKAQRDYIPNFENEIILYDMKGVINGRNLD